MIDRKAIAGNRYRTTLDPSAGLDPARENRVFYYRIPARYGFIGVHSSDALLAHCKAVRIIPRLLAISGVEVRQRGDREVNAVFPLDRLDEVATLLKAKRRVQLSPAERARRAERMKSRVKTRAHAAP